MRNKGLGIKKLAFTCVGMLLAGVTASALTLYTFANAPFGNTQTVFAPEIFAETVTAVSRLEIVQNADVTEYVDVLPDTPAEELDVIKNEHPVASEAVERAVLSELVKYTVLDNNFIYYSQRWDEYAETVYGDETIGGYGCGPTVIAMAVSTITRKGVPPTEVAALSEKWGCFIAGVGTAHAIFDKSADYYGVTVESFKSTRSEIVRRLKNGELLICSMGKGYFSNSGHFILIRGITDSGKILIADPYDEENNEREWELSYLINQLRYTTMWSYTE